eukprot:TRINITY_DN11570_c0_g1_i1.p1 TRINITY_DN11570_c0_g1~~TRINITY_DN11570_c0_g1_i1.p1  ORF type:complete len:274 (-),score=38.78 TRINITY_DN11570_c0_g1_i1:46-867(-)
MDHQNDQPEKCSRCQEFPEDILMLTCNHDLCLLCAATVFTAPENSIPRSNNELRCEQCGSLTQLDSSSIFELEKLMPQTRMRQSQQQHPQQPKIQTSTTTPQSQLGFQGSQTSDILHKYKVYDYQAQPVQPLPQPLASSIAPSQTRYQDKMPLGSSLMGSASKKQKQYCSVHTDEKISYYCYDCQTNICPECIIHGSHKDHDVGTVKKAYPIIVRKLEERIDQVSEKIKDTKLFQEKFNSVSYTHLRAHETGRNLVCRLLLEKKNSATNNIKI